MSDILSMKPARPLLEVRNLVTEFPVRNGVFRAVNDLSFSIDPGKTLCVVGESGSGKSVTARSILQIIDTARPHCDRVDHPQPRRWHVTRSGKARSAQPGHPLGARR